MRMNVNGKDIPCYVTMGAMLRFKDQTGREIGEDATPTDMVTYMYCCAKSACRREGVDFGFDNVEDFADAVLPSDFQRWAASLTEGQEPGGDENKKK